MKKITTILMMSLISLNGISQSTKGDSLIQIISSLLGEPPKHKSPNSDDTYLRGNFYKVFTDYKIWDDFAIDYNGNYLWIEAPETNWYDKQIGPEKSDKTILCEDPVMVDSKVVNYYNTMIRGFKYDTYTYEIEHQTDGTVREFYKFFVDNKKIRSYILGWNETEILTITDFDIPERR
jgi:hypothetical protein